MSRGKLIVFEGLDGSGTTTQAGLLATYLFNKDKRNRVLITREPTKDSIFGQELDRRLKGNLLPDEEVIDDGGYWASLFYNDRDWHNETIIKPNLALGNKVIIDRYRMSTDAYQSAQGADIDELIERQKHFVDPDLTLLLDVSAKTAMQRRGAESSKPEYFESLDFQKEIKRQYQIAAEKLTKTDNVVIINGHPSIEKVSESIRKKIDKLFGYDS